MKEYVLYFSICFELFESPVNVISMDHVYVMSLLLLFCDDDEDAACF